MTEKITLSELLAKFRNLTDMKQNEVASEVDVPAPSLSFYENGERTPPYQALIQLLDFFDAQLSIETDLGKWIFQSDNSGEIVLEEQPKTKELGLLNGLDDQEKEDLIAYIRRRRRNTDSN